MSATLFCPVVRGQIHFDHWNALGSWDKLELTELSLGQFQIGDQNLFFDMIQWDYENYVRRLVDEGRTLPFSHLQFVKEVA